MPREARPRRKTVVHYVDECGGRVRKGAPGARKVKVRTDTYYYRDQSLGTTDLAQAWANLRALLRREREERLGISAPGDDHAARPLAEHVAAWCRSLLDKGTSAQEVENCRSQVTKLAGWAGWKRLGDVTAAGCQKALAHLRQTVGRSARTRNHYLRHAKQLVRWCVEDRRCRDNPLAGLRPVRTEADRRHGRRDPSDAEVGLLMAHLEGGTARRRKGMTGPQRALGYRVCMATGLRAGELRSLTRESFDLDAATVRCRAAYSKNRRESVQPIPAWLVAELRAWLDAGGGLWGSFPKVHPGRLLKADLAAAGVPYVVGGLFFDFHSLRHHYVTWVANHPGISPKTLMELARLSSADLAMKTYAHARRADLHRTVEDLPRPGG